MTKELPFYILEAGPMTLCMFIFNIFHPGTVLVGDESEFPKKEKKKARGSEDTQREMIRLEERPHLDAERVEKN